jgi:hypothetical protein
MVMTTRMLETPEADLVYDIHGPLPAADGHPPLVMIGQPMDARLPTCTPSSRCSARVLSRCLRAAAVQ